MPIAARTLSIVGEMDDPSVEPPTEKTLKPARTGAARVARSVTASAHRAARRASTERMNMESLLGALSKEVEAEHELRNEESHEMGVQ